MLICVGVDTVASLSDLSLLISFVTVTENLVYHKPRIQ